ncbi:MAG: inorganic phosphate transporter [Methanospirillum sp.]|uniref:inorganic phosphate transporter n=1 Tax=Methanospirillum sp. TaxID=45200 RepID=UPI0023763562|nr:inorganic phosphate transporter [Methanospirillum sp.]MDD1727609.1 inorganic phosphate transporter [Methanospirillum sp.]
MEPILIIGIVVALLFNFLNGLHDAANSISTIVATRVLTPLQAVSLAAFFNLIGPLFFTTAIAKTIGKGIIVPGWMTIDVMIIGILVASFWIYFTAYVGIPISSTHAMIGGLIGAAVAFGGPSVVILPTLDLIRGLIWYGVGGIIAGACILTLIAYLKKEDNLLQYTGIGAYFGFVFAIPISIALHALTLSGIVSIILFIMISPSLGLALAFIFGCLIIRICRNKDHKKMNHLFNRLQIISSAFYSIGHGSNDAQHAMGVITAMLVTAGVLSDFSVPLWVILLSSAAISVGTLTGGWRIVQTMAKRITHLRPYQGFCAEAGGGLVLLLVTLFGVPVSSTHAISGCIMGVGATQGSSAVNWGMVRQIVTAWVITIPLTAVFSWIVFCVFLKIWG